MNMFVLIGKLHIVCNFVLYNGVLLMEHVSTVGRMLV